MRAIKVLGCAIALAAFIAPGARADEWNKLTYLTFSGPVQLPGVTLPAGTYTFKLADTWSNRHVVQVFDKDQTKIYGTFLTVSDQKLKPADKPVVMFRESPAGSPNAVRAWFYPGDTIGDEFVYPKEQAVEIAKNTHEPVMATDEEMSGANDASKMKSAKVGHVDENGNMTEDNEDNRANTENASNAAAQGQTAVGTTGAAAGQSASGTTGTYTAAPRESDHRTGVAENADAMNRYGQNSASASTRTTNPSMAAGGETVTSANQPAGTTASANAASAQANAQANAEANRDKKMSANDRHATGTTAVGTSGQASTNADNNAKANRNGKRNGRHLPRTASPLAAIELLSGLSIFGALGVRQLRKRVAGAR